MMIFISIFYRDIIATTFTYPDNIYSSQIRVICHFVVTYSTFNFTKLKPRCFHKLSVVLMSRKVFLRIQQTAGKLSSCVHGCQRDEFIISQCILLQFHKLMKSICSPDANSIHIRFQ